MATPEELNKLEGLLKRHDWYFEFSDDQDVWRRGKQGLDAIKHLIHSGMFSQEEVDALWQKHAPKDMKNNSPKVTPSSNNAFLEQFVQTVVTETLAEATAPGATYKGKSMRLGGGGRFASFVDRLKSQGYSDEKARAIAYKAGVKKHGKAQMAKWAQTGKKRAETKKKSSAAVDEVAPKGWEGTVKAMKKHKDISNPFALANYMKNKGYHSHHKKEEDLDLDETAMFFDEEGGGEEENLFPEYKPEEIPRIKILRKGKEVARFIFKNYVAMEDELVKNGVSPDAARKMTSKASDTFQELNILRDVPSIEKKLLMSKNPIVVKYRDAVLGAAKEEKRDLTSEVSPPGWHGTVRAMKTHGHGDEISNPYALAWSMKDKGYTPHYKDQPTSLKGTPVKKKGMMDENLPPPPITKQDVLRTLVQVLRSHPEYLRKSPEELASDFIDNVPEITDSEEVGPQELERLAALARKHVMMRQSPNG